MASNIRVHLRIRPTSKPAGSYTLNEDDKVDFELDKTGDTINNAKTKFQFKFDSILGMHATQEEVFNRVAVPVIDDALKGVNGTIFAYGQTGSGKTFTITGGTDRYVDRGLIPRTIAYVFEQMKKDQKSTFRMYISYFEIYNESGYDLLSREDSASKIDDLPKVILREDEDGNTHLKNLTVNMAGVEEDALNLLFLGDTNRVVAETPMNDASTRSHCIFILWLESTTPGTDTVRRSKIHLVDLAGSERVSKTNIEGKLLAEAKFINVSLHFLEQVIVALHERARGHRSHIPYRNSMMTSVLRDSLGGNCKTVMIANAAVEDSNIDETLSTCRFAQRVALIKNAAVINEELDPTLLIRRLKKEILELKERLSLANGGDNAEEEITPEIEDAVRKQVAQWLSEDGPILCGGYRRSQTCCAILKEMVHQRPEGTDGGEKRAPASAKELDRVKLELAQRDNEIGILVQMINKKNANEALAPASKPADAACTAHPASPNISSVRGTYGGIASPSRAAAPAAVATMPAHAVHAPAVLVKQSAPREERPRLAAPVPQGNEAVALLLDRNRAFEVFRKSVRRSETYEENVNLMKKYYADAKALGEEGNAARNGINSLKKKVEQLRLERAMTARDDEDFAAQTDPEEEALLKEMEVHKEVYTRATNALRTVKGDIERIQNMLEQNKKRLQKDFEQWFHTLRCEASQGLQEAKNEDAHKGNDNNGPAVTQHTPDPVSIKAARIREMQLRVAPKTGDASVDKDIAEYYAAIQNIHSSGR
eukprot:GEMP01009908.1.p1 GENE.GEMP01009908.1~~GEMP01009908.1.p1  ORF type:complete len:768 (+),score=203.78 GEMP01009908.1:47-2350(+)